MHAKGGLLSFLFLVALSCAGADFYVASDGKSTNAGTLASPWDYSKVFNNTAAPVNAGDTVYFRGGLYKADASMLFRVRKGGTAGLPITFRAYNKERVRLDGGIEVLAPWTIIRDFEVQFTIANRRSTQTGSFPTDIIQPSGINVTAANVKIINNIVHDCGNGLSSWSSAPDTEIHGNIVYYCGWDAPDRGHGHGAYMQNATGQKLVAENMFFNQFGQGMQIYGSSTASINNFTLKGNVVFNNGSMSGGFTRNILLGGDSVAQNPVLQNNYTYYSPTSAEGDNNLGYYAGGAGCANAVFENNYFAAKGISLSLQACTFTSMKSNVLIGEVRNFSPATYPNNTYIASTTRPAAAYFVRPNAFELGRANVVVYNWDLRNSVTVDVSAAGLQPGDTYKLRNVQNYFGDVISGTYTGAPITIPMTNHTMAAPIAWNAPASTFPEFGAFVLQKDSGGTPPPPGDTTSPVVSISSPVNNATTVNTISINATASDNVGVSGVQFKVDGNNAGAEDTIAPYTIQFDTKTLSNGVHTISAVARDAAGNNASAGAVSISVNNAGQGEVLYNGIVLPADFPAARTPTQAYSLPSYITQPPSVIPIDLGRQLFVDDFLVESTTLTRTQHRPVMYSGNPVLRPSGTDRNGYAMPFSDGVWYDPKDRMFKMWYFNGGPSIAYATSSDGKTWTKPSLPNADIANTNIVLSSGGGRDSGTVWMDLETTNLSQRFKAFMYQGGGQQTVFFSPDGIDWTKQPYTFDSLSDRTTLFWNPFRKLWVRSGRLSATLPATTTVPSRSSRSRYYGETRDFINWKPAVSDATFWCSTDDRDLPYPGTTEMPHLYNLDCVAYESVMLGMFSLYYPTPGPEVVELNVGFSRDGFNWVRPTRGAKDNAFIPVTNKDGDWNGFNTQSVGGCCMVVGDELWFYFSGRNARHGVVPTLLQTGLATMRRDGFYSMDAATAEGTLTTRAVKFAGSRLFVNVNNPGGRLQVEILDAATNAVIAPFSKANSVVTNADKTLLEMKWTGAADLSSIAGRNVKFKFYLTNGSLYAFWISNGAAGASNGYVAAGGPGFTGPTDTVGNSTADTISPSVSITSPANAATVSGVVTVNATAADNVGVAGVQFLLDGTSLGAEISAAPYQASWDTASTTVGTHVLSARARDAAGNTALSTSVSVNVQRPVNRPPVISSAATATPNPAVVGTSVALVAAATDPDNDVLSYAWAFGDGASGTGASTSHVYAIGGSYTATITANDGRGGSVSSSIKITVTAPPPPPPPPQPYVLNVDATQVAPRQTVTVTWQAANTTAKDWIGLYKVGDPNSRYRWWAYTGGTATGSKAVAMPGDLGQYEFRYLTNNSQTSVAASPVITIGTGASSPVSALAASVDEYTIDLGTIHFGKVSWELPLPPNVSTEKLKSILTPKIRGLNVKGSKLTGVARKTGIHEFKIKFINGTKKDGLTETTQSYRLQVEP